MKRGHEEVVYSQWKTSKSIEGVSASAIVDFKASVANAGSKSGKGKVRRVAGQLNVKKLSVNKGVQSRATRDEEDALRDKEDKGLEYAQQKLREKSEIYDRIASGAMVDPAMQEEYLIDFEQKNWDEEDRLALEGGGGPNGREGDAAPGAFFAEDREREEERLRWMRQMDNNREEEERESEKRKEERIALSRVIVETQKGRSRAQRLKEERERKLAVRKLRLQKRAELKKEKLAAAQYEKSQADAAATAEREKKKLRIKKK